MTDDNGYVTFKGLTLTFAMIRTAKRNPKMFARDNVVNSRGVGGEHE